jgi:2-amino-4-hydroxy-6-hydroxymethyldihydropteridine diphosphokinase
LLYDDLVMKDERMEIPRGEITEYEFVLRPLAEICGEYMHPVLKKTIAELWQEFERGEDEMRVVELARKA